MANNVYNKDFLELGKGACKGSLSDAEIVQLYSFSCLPGQEISDFPFSMALRASQFGDFRWPWKIRDYFRGRRVLDIGCGQGTDCLGFITLGALSYCGLDTGAELDSDVVKRI